MVSLLYQYRKTSIPIQIGLVYGGFGGDFSPEITVPPALGFGCIRFVVMEEDTELSPRADFGGYGERLLLQPLDLLFGKPGDFGDLSHWVTLVEHTQGDQF